MAEFLAFLIKLPSREIMYALVGGTLVIMLLVKLIEYWKLRIERDAKKEFLVDHIMLVLWGQIGRVRSVVMEAPGDRAPRADRGEGTLLSLAVNLTTFFSARLLDLGVNLLIQVVAGTAEEDMEEDMEEEMPTEKADAVLQGRMSKSKLTIVGLLIGQKARKTAVGYVVLLLGIFVYLILSPIVGFQIDPSVLVFPSLLLVVLFINQKALEYRISRGFYGANENEAREIIGFILSHSDKSDFPPGRRLMAIFPETETEETIVPQEAEGARGITP